MILLAIAGKKVNGMSIKPDLLAAIPSPACIWVRKAAVTFTVPITVSFTGTGLDSIAGRRYRKAGTIAGYRECRRIN